MRLDEKFAASDVEKQMSLVLALLSAMRAAFKARAALALENLALRQELALLRRRSTRPRFGILERHLLRDRDSIYGTEFRQRVRGIGIAEALTAPRSPWQNPFAERVISTIRRELLDHVIVLNEGHLRRRLRSYFRYYHGSRTHLALEKDAPEPRAMELPEHGAVVALPQVGGLHHRYLRRAA